MLTHTDIWRAIDRLAENNQLSPSGLAKKAGLCATLFNPSKRTHAGRKRWPSTESIALILKATHTDMDQFMSLVSSNPAPMQRIKMIGLDRLAEDSLFDDEGHPSSKAWDEMEAPVFSDPDLFAIEVTDRQAEPIYREGDRLIVSPKTPARRLDRVVVKTVDGDVMIKILGRETASKVELLPLDPGAAAMSCLKRDLSWFYRVVWASQ